MFLASQLHDLIIKPTLIDLVMFSEEAAQLLLFTCASESDGGKYLKQIKGPALGIYQMEPKTYNDIWQNYINEKGNLLLQLISNFHITQMPSEDRLIYDLRFATAMARIHYHRVPYRLPALNDIDELWLFYKHYYNTPEGSATKDESISKFYKFINN